jgi:hypothetical protein
LSKTQVSNGFKFEIANKFDEKRAFGAQTQEKRQIELFSYHFFFKKLHPEKKIQKA